MSDHQDRSNRTTAFTAEEIGWVLSARDQIAKNRRCPDPCRCGAECECLKRAEAALRRIMS